MNRRDEIKDMLCSSKFFCICRALLFLLLFCVIFALLQALLVPKFRDSTNNSTAVVEGFLALPKDSLDILFLGGSQMAYAVDAELLTRKHGLSSYDFGANGQMLPTTLYYLEQAFMHQHPRFVMLEAGQLFDKNAPDEAYYAWNMSPMPLSWSKWKHLMQLSGGNARVSFMHLFPLLQYHSRWKELNAEDFRLAYCKRENSSRGHLASPFCQRVSPCAGRQHSVLSQDTIECLEQMLKLCNANGARMLIFKTPTACCSPELLSSDAIFDRLQLSYWDFNENVQDIGLDYGKDFVDELHLNANGAAVFSSFLAGKIKQLLKETPL